MIQATDGEAAAGRPVVVDLRRHPPELVLKFRQGWLCKPQALADGQIVLVVTQDNEIDETVAVLDNRR